jgi:hypothetical protein
VVYGQVEPAGRHGWMPRGFAGMNTPNSVAAGRRKRFNDLSRMVMPKGCRASITMLSND